nr:YBR098W [Saccharomyces cerevisiae]CAA55603.1 YBR0826 [Saccharomyces cerevisiae]CAA85051.1 unnamed protein product [Saccharomyces cerevisiae]
MSQIVDFVEDKDSRNDASIQIIDGPSNVEIIALSESMDQDECKRAHVSSAEMIPSSPQRKSVSNDVENVDLNKSIELSAPFFQDISISKLDDFSTTVNSIIDSSLRNENNAKGNAKKLLDDLISDEWSADLESSGKKHNKSQYNLRDIAEKWGVQSLKNPEPIAVDCEYKTQGIGKTNSDISDSPKSQIGAADILFDFPLSPVKHENPTEEKHNSIANENSSPDNSLKPAGKQNHGEDGTSMAKRVYNKGEDEQEHLPKGKKRTIALSRTLINSTKLPDTVELNLSKFLDSSDSITTDVLSTPAKGSNIVRTGSQPIFSNANCFQEAKRSKTLTAEDPKCTKNTAREVSQLENYIAYGQYYTREDSKNKIRHLLKENKNAFKRVNQIYRDNIKARSQMIIEFSPSLLQLFKKGDSDLQQQLAPAVVQSSYNDSMPLLRFLRKCDSIYDFSNDFYYPCDPKIVEENRFDSIL